MIAVVTGGASSGKSAYAEELVMNLAAEGNCQLVYLATMQPYGSEGARRIARHRNLRAGKGFATIEAPRALSNVNVAQALPRDRVLSERGHDPSGAATPTAAFDASASHPFAILLEDLGNLVANELFRDDGSVQPAESVVSTVTDGVTSLAPQCTHLVVVTNEIGSDGIDYAPETRDYQEILGACSCALAAQADLVVEVTNSLPHILKGSVGGDAR